MNPRIAIVGSGAIESYYGAKLACAHALESAAAGDQIKRTKEMGEYEPSTLLDWEAGKPLEIEAIWGEPLRRAAAAGAKTPRVEMTYALLKSLDAKRR